MGNELSRYIESLPREISLPVDTTIAWSKDRVVVSGEPGLHHLVGRHLREIDAHDIAASEEGTLTGPMRIVATAPPRHGTVWSVTGYQSLAYPFAGLAFLSVWTSRNHAAHPLIAFHIVVVGLLGMSSVTLVGAFKHDVLYHGEILKHVLKVKGSRQC